MKPGYEDFAELGDSLCRLFNYKDSLQRKCAYLGEMECKLLNLLTSLDEPVRMSTLSEELQVSHSRITRVVDGLVKKGLVTRVQSQQDRRKRRAQLSQEGLNATRHISCETREIQEKLISRLPADEIEDIFRKVKLYIDIYQEVLEEKDSEYSTTDRLTPWHQPDRGGEE